MLDPSSLLAQNIKLVHLGQDRPQTPAARICVFDADARWCHVIGQMLQESGYCVTVRPWTEGAIAALASEAYDLIILNLESAVTNTPQILKNLRQTQHDIPLIVTTAHASAESAIAAVKANVVDYIVKPYQPSDLLLTISRALEERAQQLRQQQLLAMVSQTLEALKQSGVAETAARPVLVEVPIPIASLEATRVGEVELDRQKRQLIWNADPVRTVELTESELTIMVTLMENPNQVVSCNVLGSALGYQHMDKWTIENVIRSVVFRLRQKLETDSQRSRLIHTVRGRGYYFAPG